MSRPGFVLTVDERTPPLLVHAGDRLRLERLPLGARVVYPADPVAPVPAVRESIDAALDAPLDSEPLAGRLRPGMRLTISFDDITRPSPPMRRPDIRGLIMEAVLSRAAAAGVDDVAVVAARGLNRRMTVEELQGLVGERVFRSFHTDGLLTQHDAEDPDQLTSLGATEQGDVAVNTRAATSDLLVHIHVAVTPRSGGAEQVAAGLGSAATIGQLNGWLTGEESVRTIAGHVEASIPVFTVAAVLDNSWYPEPVSFLGEREWEWSLRNQATGAILRNALAVTRPRARRRLRNAVPAGYRTIGIHAGAPATVAEASRRQVLSQQGVEVGGQSDVVLIGVPSVTPYSVDSITNPLLAAWQGLAATLGSHTGTPVLRRGGAAILYHPLAADFSPLHHPAFVDFYDTVLPTTSDPEAMASDLEQKFATDPWYIELYRTSYAFHGVHPFHLWYQLAGVRSHCGDVVWVGADRTVAHRLGFRAASTLADALEIVTSSVGSSPSITYLHAPPALVADVR
jgi:lactate racemase